MERNVVNFFCNQSTNEETHVSCGWAHLPFIDEQKNMIGNKGYDLILNGGGIFDQKGKPLNEDLARLSIIFRN